MVRIAGSGAYHIVVVDQKTTEGDVARVIVLPERKAVVRLGPVSPGQETQPRATQLNARRTRRRRTHWFSIAGRRNRGLARLGVASPHVRSPYPGTHRAWTGISLGLSAAACDTCQRRGN